MSEEMNAADMTVDSETGEVVESTEIVPAAPARMEKLITRKRAEKLIADIQNKVGAIRRNLVELRDGHAWEALGFPDWYSMTYAVFGFQPRQTRYLVETAIVEAETAPLLSADSDSALLSRLSDDAIQALKHLEPAARALVIHKLSERAEVPTLRVVLETIPANMLTEKQVKQLEKLWAKDNPRTGQEGVTDWYDFGRQNLSKIIKAFRALDNPDVIAALEYESFTDMIQNELPALGKLFDPAKYGEWGVIDSVAEMDYDPTDDDPFFEPGESE